MILYNYIYNGKNFKKNKNKHNEIIKEEENHNEFTRLKFN